MSKPILLLYCVLLSYGEGLLFRDLYKDTGKLMKAREGADVGEPLILTPFINNGSIAEGQQAALVQHSQFQNVVSYSGYFTVDERFDSNMWFWYFPSADNVNEDPVVLWLNGGPGATSLNGLFDENGPFIVNEDSSVSLREYSWHKNHSVIFIDNPVGVGYSFTNGGFAENETKVGDDMYSCLTQFFQLFPDLQSNPFFISGESYAGKYVPAIGYAILKKSPQADLKINLQGILIGDGWTDPVNQLNYGPFVYNTGLVSAAVKEDIDKHRDAAIEKVNAGEYIDALKEYAYIIRKIDGISIVNIYNYIKKYDDFGYWETFVTTDEIRKALHVGNATFRDQGAGYALNKDRMVSVAPWLEELLENYRVLIFVGQLDIIGGYPMIVDYLQLLNFTGMDDYHSSKCDYINAMNDYDDIIFAIRGTTAVDIYSYISLNTHGSSGNWQLFVTTDEMRKALHVGEAVFGDQGAGSALYEDELISVARWLEELIEHYRVLIYVGQLDILVGYPMTVDYLQTLNFTGTQAYHSSSRDIWYVDQEPAGYVKTGGNLVELLVRNAGHMVPSYQPKWAYDMLHKFTRNIPYTSVNT